MTLPSTVPCPVCGKPVPTTEGERPESFPFCCPRCRLIDLGRWVEGRHVMPGTQPVDPET